MLWLQQIELAWSGKVKGRFAWTHQVLWTGYDTILKRHSKSRSNSDSHRYRGVEHGSGSIEAAIQFGCQAGFLSEYEGFSSVTVLWGLHHDWKLMGRAISVSLSFFLLFLVFKDVVGQEKWLILNVYTWEWIMARGQDALEIVVNPTNQEREVWGIGFFFFNWGQT